MGRRDDSPGCPARRHAGGELVYARGYGMANVEHGAPITPETVFDIGSVTKQFTASAMLLLDAEGRLTLEDALAHIGHPPIHLANRWVSN